MSERIVVISINTSWNIVNFRLGLIRGLQAAGYTVVALTPTDRFSARFAAEGIRHVPIAIDQRGTSPRADLQLLLHYRDALKHIRPVAYLGYTIKPNVWGSLAARQLGIPVINNIAGLGETFTGTGLLNMIVRRLYRIALRGSARVFFQNPDDRMLFVTSGIVAAEKTGLLPGSGIDTDRFVPPSDADEGAKTSAEFRFLLMARLLWAKGIADYVDAARRVRARHPHVRIQLLGLAQKGRGAIDRETLARWVSEDAVELLEPTDDVRPILGSADCVVLPTFYPEGTPRVLLEAAAMGRPIIATDVPGCREIVRDDQNGFLVPPHSPDILAERMDELVAMPSGRRRLMERNSRRIAEQDYDERIVIAKYLEALAAI